MPTDASTPSAADRNWRWFVWFRVLFSARFYYPVMAVLFLDLGLSASQYTLLNFAWAIAIVAGVLRALRDGGDPEATFGRALPWLPVWLGLVLVIVGAAFWRWRADLAGWCGRKRRLPERGTVVRLRGTAPAFSRNVRFPIRCRAATFATLPPA